MAIEKRTCAFHPGRLAIGVCVETKVPICGECSTRYEGVNYSKEGLRLLQARRAAKNAKAGSSGIQRHIVNGLYSAFAAGCVYVMYLGYFLLFGVITDLLFPPDAKTAEQMQELRRLLELLGQ